MNAIASIPCFEIWLLLHFLYTTKAYIAPLQDSNAALVIRDLKAHLPDYEKSSKDTFAVLADRTETAIRNAKSLEKFHETSGPTIHPPKFTSMSSTYRNWETRTMALESEAEALSRQAVPLLRAKAHMPGSAERTVRTLVGLYLAL